MRSETPLPTFPPAAVPETRRRPEAKPVAREPAPDSESALDEPPEPVAVVEGTVRDERGVTVAAGAVSLFGEVEKDAPIGADGRYRLEAPAGTTGFLRTVVPEHVSPPSFETVALVSGTTVRDFEVLRVWVVTGRLLTPEGRPFTRARLEIENPPPGEPVSDNDGPAADGTFRHRFSPPLEAKSILPVRLSFPTAAGPLALRVIPEDRIDALVPLDVERLRADALIDVGDIVLRRGGALGVLVREPGGAPVAGASLTLQFRGGEEGTGVGTMRTGTSDAGGRARFDGLEAGSYVLVAREDRHVATLLTPVDVAERGAEAEVEVVMERGVAIEGVVVDEAGDPVADARVRVDALPALAADGGGFAEIKTARTAADGSFRVEGLPPDHRERFERLAARRKDSGEAPPPEPFVVRADAFLAEPLSGEAAGVTPGEPVTIVLRTGRR